MDSNRDSTNQDLLTISKKNYAEHQGFVEGASWELKS
jgi:hypothetical protein